MCMHAWQRTRGRQKSRMLCFVQFLRFISIPCTSVHIHVHIHDLQIDIFVIMASLKGRYCIGNDGKISLNQDTQFNIKSVKVLHCVILKKNSDICIQIFCTHSNEQLRTEHSFLNSNCTFVEVIFSLLKDYSTSDKIVWMENKLIGFILFC